MDSPSALTRVAAPAKEESESDKDEKAGPSKIKGEPEFIYIDFWNNRTCGQKVARGFYVFLRMFFASVWFYFIPYSVLYFSYLIPFMYEQAERQPG